VLAIDDEPSVLRMLRLELSTQGYDVLTSSNGVEALEIFAQRRPHVVIIDLIMEGELGLDLLRRIKSSADTPVIVISAESGKDTVMESMSLGADDFIAKPFHPQRVSDSVEFLMKKGRGEPTNPIVVAGNVQVDLARHIVTRDGEHVALSRSEWQLLEQLARSPGEPRLYQELLSSVWGSEYRDEIAFLRTWIDRLRAKLGDACPQPKVILPYLDVGYILAVHTRPN
jgi:two-component system KDP operon response regulator KdpE